MTGEWQDGDTVSTLLDAETRRVIAQVIRSGDDWHPYELAGGFLRRIRVAPIDRERAKAIAEQILGV